METFLSNLTFPNRRLHYPNIRHIAHFRVKRGYKGVLKTYYI